MFHRYLNPERAMPADALAVHGLSAEFLADKPLFGAVADEFLTFVVGDAPLVVHNAGFLGTLTGCCRSGTDHNDAGLRPAGHKLSNQRADADHVDAGQVLAHVVGEPGYSQPLSSWLLGSMAR